MSRTDEIVTAARLLLQDYGWPEISLRDIANEIGIKAPSLYKHVSGMVEIAALVATEGLSEYGQYLREGWEENGATGILVAHRDFFRENPYLYELMTSRLFPREYLPGDLLGWAREPFHWMADNDTQLGLSYTAMAHGLALLELRDGRIPDPQWEYVVAE